jgi:hypothetical protein
MSVTPAANTNSTPAGGSAAPAGTASALKEILPNPATLLHASRLAIQQDKPIQLDYYVESATGKAVVGKDPETGEKMLMKSNDEFTSLIVKIYKANEDFIIITENSIYIVSGKIHERKINVTQMRTQDYETL